MKKTTKINMTPRKARKPRETPVKSNLIRRPRKDESEFPKLDAVSDLNTNMMSLGVTSDEQEATAVPITLKRELSTAGLPESKSRKVLETVQKPGPSQQSIKPPTPKLPDLTSPDSDLHEDTDLIPESYRPPPMDDAGAQALIRLVNSGLAAKDLPYSFVLVGNHLKMLEQDLQKQFHELPIDSASSSPVPESENLMSESNMTYEVKIPPFMGKGLLTVVSEVSMSLDKWEEMTVLDQVKHILKKDGRYNHIRRSYDCSKGVILRKK